MHFQPSKFDTAYIYVITLSTLWRPAAFWDLRKKPTKTHMALRGNFSGPVSATDPVKSSKDSASPVVCTWKKLFWLGGAGFFVSDVISGGLLGHLFFSGQDSDLSLVCNENFSEIPPSNSLRPGPGNVSQNGPKTTSLMTSFTKNSQPPTKIFFRVQTITWLNCLSPWTAL